MQNEVTSKRKNGVERTRYNFGAQVKSRAELMKFLQVKREKKAQEDKIEGIKASRNVRGTKATMAEVEGQRSKPKKPSLNAAKIPTNEVEGHNNKQTKRINLPSFSIASYSQEKNSKFATSDESRTKVTKENTQSKGCIQIEDPKSRVTKKVVAKVTKENTQSKGRINDAWRRYKNYIRKNYFLKYPNLRERLKHRPKRVPGPDFKRLMIFWGNNIVQDICKKNAVNRAKQRYMHRMGTRNFARIKAEMRAKKEDGSDVTQAEMFIETRTSRKGKEVDQDTQNVVTKLHDSIQESKECAGKTFESLFGKEKAGRVRCFGRMVTPTVLKRNEEIADIKRQCSKETARMAKQVNGLQGLVKCLLKQVNPDLDDEALDNIMENAMDVECGASTSMHTRNVEKEIHPTGEEGQPDDEDHPGNEDQEG